MNSRKFPLIVSALTAVMILASCGIPTALLGGFGYHVQGQDVFYTSGGGSASPVTTNKVFGADGREFQVLNRHFGKDRYHVYIGTYSIANADVSTFSVLSESYAKDKYRAYFLGFPIIDADVESFTVNDDGNARDNKRCYSGAEGSKCTNRQSPAL